jgi:hypothetical protein
MAEEIGDQIAEGQKQQATKADVAILAKIIRPLLEDRQTYDTHRVPSEHINFIQAPEE